MSGYSKLRHHKEVEWGFDYSSFAWSKADEHSSSRWESFTFQHKLGLDALVGREQESTHCVYFKSGMEKFSAVLMNAWRCLSFSYLLLLFMVVDTRSWPGLTNVRCYGTFLTWLNKSFSWRFFLFIGFCKLDRNEVKRVAYFAKNKGQVQILLEKNKR